jgi:hypothetical protein
LSRLELLLTASGVVLLLAALLWRAHHRARADRRIRAALASADPAEQRAAIAILAGTGLARFADDLLALLRTAERERRDDLVASLTVAVARTSWEPLQSPALVELRLAAAVAGELRAAPRTIDITTVQDEPDVDHDLLDATQMAIGHPVLSLRLDRGTDVTVIEQHDGRAIGVTTTPADAEQAAVHLRARLVGAA